MCRSVGGEVDQVKQERHVGFHATELDLESVKERVLLDTSGYQCTLYGEPYRLERTNSWALKGHGAYIWLQWVCVNTGKHRIWFQQLDAMVHANNLTNDNVLSIV